MRRAALLLLALSAGAWAAAPTAEPPEGVTNATQRALEAFAAGDFQGAQKDFKRLAEQEPDNALFQLNLGTVEFRLKNYEAAETALTRSVRLDSDNAAAWLALGVLLLGRDRLEEATAALTRSVVLDPQNARAHAFLGVAIGKRGWLLGAEQELRRAIEIEPRYADAHFNLALFYLQRSPPAVELARRHYEKALSLGAAKDELVEKQLNP